MANKPFRFESLGHTLKSVTYDMKNLKLWPNIKGFEITPKALPEWSKLFKVESKQVTDVTETKTLWIVRKTETSRTVFAVVNIKNDETIGEYRDYEYACSRARFYYKKYMRASERILLGG